MIKPHTLALSLGLLGGSFPVYAQLMFSQYIDGSANRKGLEWLRIIAINGLEKGFPTERGATFQVEFNKQRSKIVKALKSIDVDVYVWWKLPTMVMGQTVL